jgi:hypothetical protein
LVTGALVELNKDDNQNNDGDDNENDGSDDEADHIIFELARGGARGLKVIIPSRSWSRGVLMSRNRNISVIARSWRTREGGLEREVRLASKGRHLYFPEAKDVGVATDRYSSEVAPIHIVELNSFAIG